MINKISIIQLAEIITGYPFRTSLGELAGDDIMVVQAKDILVGSDINLNNAFKIAHQNFNSKSLLPSCALLTFNTKVGLMRKSSGTLLNPKIPVPNS